MEREELCLVIDQLIKTDDTFLNNKTKLYCEYCLSLGKEYVDSIRPGLYEKCEKFNISNNKMEDIEEQFITSYKSKLTKKGEEVCKDILVFIGEKDEMKRMKAKAFCEFFLSFKLDRVDDSELKEKCRDYLEYLNDFQRYNHAFESIGRERKEILDMRCGRIKNL